MTDEKAQLDEAVRYLKSLARAMPLTHHHASQLLDAIAEIERLIDAIDDSQRLEAACEAGITVAGDLKAEAEQLRRRHVAATRPRAAMSLDEAADLCRRMAGEPAPKPEELKP